MFIFLSFVGFVAVADTTDSVDQTKTTHQDCVEFISDDKSQVFVSNCSDVDIDTVTDDGSSIQIESQGSGNTVIVNVGEAGSKNTRPALPNVTEIDNSDPQDENNAQDTENSDPQETDNSSPQIDSLPDAVSPSLEIREFFDELRERSPQGISVDIEKRRQDALKRFERNFYIPNRIRGREIRQFDGTGNNRRNPTWGGSFSHLQRLGDADYGDGVSSLAGQNRPSARVISNLVSHQGQNEDLPNSFGTSDYLWQWGQFIDHDLGLTDGSTDEAINIVVPQGDIFFDPTGSGGVEIPVNRAVNDPNTGTDTTNPREQENEITSWIDG